MPNRTMTTVNEYALKRSKRADFFKRYGVAILFLAPHLLFFLVFCIYPLFYGIYMSLFKYSIADPSMNEWRGLQNFITILFNHENQYSMDFWYAMGNTVCFALVIIPLSIIIPLFLAICINAKPRGYKIFRAVIYLPSVLPVSASGVIFTALFGYLFGYVNQWFGISVNWLNSNPMLAWFVILLLCLWGGWGGNFIILNAGLKNVDKSLYEAASVDGCTGFRRALAVTLPAIKPQMILCIFNTIIGYFGLYGQVYVLTNAGPITDTTDHATMTVMWYLQNLINGGNSYSVYGMVSAMGLILGAIIGAITAVQLIVTRERKSGTKYRKAFNDYINVKAATAAEPLCAEQTVKSDGGGVKENNGEEFTDE